MILWMPGARQPVALHGVGKNDGRPGVVDVGEGLPELTEIMTPEIGYHPSYFGVGHRVEQARHD